MSSGIDPTKSFAFFSIVGKLKTLKRTGWIDHEVPLPESVADHMYRMSMLCFMLTDPSIDKDRLIKICMIHDLAEAIVGDITPEEVSGVSKEDKQVMEIKALEEIVEDIGHPEIAGEIKELWMEYEDGETELGKIAKQLDKYEMILQADEYERTHIAEKKKLESFFSYTEGYFTHPEIMKWDKFLRAQRNKRWSEMESPLQDL